jgi:uncharacterized protein
MSAEEIRAPEDLFIIPRGRDRNLVYAPLRRGVALVNDAGAAAVTKFLEDGGDGLGAAAMAVVDELKARGLLGGQPQPAPTFPSDYVFCPHEVTLFLTSRCNLRCSYCYADAGKKSLDMAPGIAAAAIDLVAENAGLLGSKSFAVGFHGGGEPTVAWTRLVACVEYAQRVAERKGLDCELFLATNGLLSQRKLAFIADNFSNVNVSLDGPADVQDHNRIKANGQGSYRQVSRALKYFDRRNLLYGIRATITAGTVWRMEEIFDALRREFKFRYLHLEPVWHCGRCLTSGETPPDDEAFMAQFLKVARKARGTGVKVSYSGARLDVLTSKFCAAPGDGFTVLPEGIVTSCYEITESTDRRADIFHYGRYEPKTGRFVFDQARIHSLREFSVEHLPFCRDCFCKWHCAGDCLAKVFEKSGAASHQGSIRCRLNRELTLAGLDELIEEEMSAASLPPSEEDAHAEAAR